MIKYLLKRVIILLIFFLNTFSATAMKNDIIVKINNIQVQGKSLTESVDLMRGPVGSGIELTVRRRGNKKAITFNIIREIIESKTVKAELLDKNIGYVRLTQFNENTGKQIKKDI